MNAAAARPVRSPWPRRLARATAVLTLPLILLGGLVTTLRVGMAVPDWPTTFGHNMFTYPLAEMLANGGVFWEHTHRLFGSAVGLAAIVLVVVHLRFEPRRTLRVLSVAVLVAVIVQGILGGVRVLRISDELAFLHGSLAQAVFALMGAVAVMQSDAWVAARGRPRPHAKTLRRVALLATGVVYAQIVIGAWLRHTGNMNALGLHVVMAAAATAAVIVLARELNRAAGDVRQRGQDEGTAHAGAAMLRVLARRLVLVLWAQVVLGLLAAVWVYLVTGPHNPVSVGEAIFATLHVGFGALLLLLCVSSTLWSHHAVARGPAAEAGTAVDTAESTGATPLEGAR